MLKIRTKDKQQYCYRNKDYYSVYNLVNKLKENDNNFQVNFVNKNILTILLGKTNTILYVILAIYLVKKSLI